MPFGLATRVGSVERSLWRHQQTGSRLSTRLGRGAGRPSERSTTETATSLRAVPMSIGDSPLERLEDGHADGYGQVASSVVTVHCLTA